jgi:hypothetical protein
VTTRLERARRFSEDALDEIERLRRVLWQIEHVDAMRYVSMRRKVDTAVKLAREALADEP